MDLCTDCILKFVVRPPRDTQRERERETERQREERGRAFGQTRERGREC